jgi:hypothetical protein
MLVVINFIIDKRFGLDTKHTRLGGSTTADGEG